MIGRNWALAALLAAENRPGLLRPLLRFRAGPYRYDKRQWEDEFDAGGWDFLSGPLESHRNAVLAGCLARHAPDASILEIGCGTGALRRALRADGYRSYLGVDLSDAALARARETADPRCSFTAGAAESFTPPGRFDAIVFAETLYYLADPVAQAVRYGGWLAERGHLFVSMALCGLRDGLWKIGIWKGLRERFEVVDEIDLYFPGHARAPSVAWTVKVLKPLAPARPGAA